MNTLSNQQLGIYARAQSIRKVEQYFKPKISKICHLLTGKHAFPCDSHPRICMACIRIRFKLRGLNPYIPRTDYIPVYTQTGIYIWKKSWKSRDYPLVQVGPREIRAKVFGFYEYYFQFPQSKVILRSELPIVKAHFVFKGEK